MQLPPLDGMSSAVSRKSMYFHESFHYYILSYLPLERPRRRWEDNIKMDLREVDCNPRNWIPLAEDGDQWRAYVRAAMS